MKFARITLNLPLNQLFDYSIPPHIENINIGSRVLIDFAGRKHIGYIVDVKNKSNIKKIKPILKPVDQRPILSANLLKFTKLLAKYYHSSWGQMIESALPKALRNQKSFEVNYASNEKQIENHDKTKKDIFIVLDSGNELRFNFYGEKIQDSLNQNKQIIILSPDVESTANIKKFVDLKFKVETCILNRYQTIKESIGNWIAISSGTTKIVIGTMSSIFAPCNNLGLIIVDEEDSQTYKQNRTPFYDARQAAIFRSNLEHCDLILGSKCLSLKSYYLTKTRQACFAGRQAKLIHLKKEQNAIVDVIDMNREFYRTKKGELLSSRLEQEINSIIVRKENIGIFINRLGFAATLKCKKCNFILKCPNCNVNLAYDFKIKKAYCRYCNYKIDTPKFCPTCKDSYLNYLGAGVEKLESHLHRLFPNSKIKSWQKQKDSEGIFIVDRKAIKENILFENTAAILSDILLNLSDFDAAEKTFSLMYRLFISSQNKFYIQTYMPRHYCWQALKKNNPFLFYDKELKLRKELRFPPYWHFLQIILRGKENEKLKEKISKLHNYLSKEIDAKLVIYPAQPAYPEKLRGNFRWQLLLKAKDIKKATQFLNKHLQNFHFSNMILTVNIDP